jgi:hypothetical protein
MSSRQALLALRSVVVGETARSFYSLYAWVIMPDHVHVVFEPKAALPGIMRWLKGRTGRVANCILGLEEIIAYVESNPMNAGLVESKEQWPWSSARFRADDTHRSSAPRESVPAPHYHSITSTRV